MLKVSDHEHVKSFRSNGDFIDLPRSLLEKTKKRVQEDSHLLEISSHSSNYSSEPVRSKNLANTIEGAEMGLNQYKRKASVNFEPLKIGSLKPEDGMISRVWIDPEVLDDPLYVEHTVQYTKHRVIIGGELKTVYETMVKRKQDIYDQYDRGQLVVPRPSTEKLNAFLYPRRALRKLKNAVSFIMRARSQRRLSEKLSLNLTDHDPPAKKPIKLAKLTNVPKSNKLLPDTTRHLSVTDRYEYSPSKSSKSEWHKTKPKAMETVLSRIKLRRRAAEKLSKKSYVGPLVPNQSLRSVELVRVYE